MNRHMLCPKFLAVQTVTVCLCVPYVISFSRSLYGFSVVRHKANTVQFVGQMVSASGHGPLCFNIDPI